MPRRGTILTVLGCRGREAAAVGAGVDQPLSTDHRLGASSAGKPVIDDLYGNVLDFENKSLKVSMYTLTVLTNHRLVGSSAGKPVSSYDRQCDDLYSALRWCFKKPI